jgi:hypothetical protein
VKTKVHAGSIDAKTNCDVELNNFQVK